MEISSLDYASSTPSLMRSSYTSESDTVSGSQENYDSENNSDSLTDKFQTLFSQSEHELYDDNTVGNVSHRVCRYPEYGQTVRPGQLIFNANFESGNLGSVQFVTEYEYDLSLRPDTCNSSSLVWFNFSVSNVKEGQKVIFNIINTSRGQSLHREGMGPVVSSTRNPCWERLPSHLVFFYKSPPHMNRYVLSFVFQFPRSLDRYQFAYSFPYTYSRLSGYLKQLSTLSPSILSLEVLCTSIQQRQTYLLTISSPANLRTNTKTVVFITSRVHPGESPASFVCQGLIDFLVSDQPAALALRDRLVFKIVPMLNPDGVVLGNYRSSLLGQDLNRQWEDPSPFKHPTIYHTKLLLQALDRDTDVNLDFYIDIHAHSTVTNGFMYGNVFKDENRFERQLKFPKLLANRASDFSWAKTTFDKNVVKAGTGRRCLGNSLSQNTLCYTMEVSLFSYTTQSEQQQQPYTELVYFKLGKNIGLALLDNYNLET